MRVLYAGCDLHGNNNLIGIVDGEGKRVFKKKLSNDLKKPSLLCSLIYQGNVCITSRHTKPNDYLTDASLKSIIMPDPKTPTNTLAITSVPMEGQRNSGQARRLFSWSVNILCM
jgi:hypothetical protein